MVDPPDPLVHHDHAASAGRTVPVALAHGCDHVHSAPDAATLVAAVEAACAGRERRLTPMRRRVLEVLAGSKVPLGAYDIMDVLGSAGDRPAPISVYRALDFLVAEGFVHRLESRNAFLMCTHRHGAGEPVVFLICERCGATAEASSPALLAAIQAAAAGQGFAPRAPVIEVPGLCARCHAP